MRAFVISDTAGSSSISTVTNSQRSSARARLSAKQATIGSPTCRTFHRLRLAEESRKPGKPESALILFTSQSDLAVKPGLWAFPVL